METTAIAPNQFRPSEPVSDKGLGTLDGDDFFKIMLVQLQNQDPLEPQKNEALLEQIATIRSMELNKTLTDAVSQLVEQQRFASSSSLIGQYALGEIEGADGETDSVQGIVVGLRFQQNGKAILELDSGREVPLERVNEVTSAERAAENLIGLEVWGDIGNAGGDPTPVSGLVDSFRFDERNQPILILESGEELPLRDLLGFKLPGESGGAFGP